MVTGLGRRKVAGYDHISYDLREPVNPDVLRAFDTVIHCAYDLRATTFAEIEHTNVRGTKALARAASQAGSRVILASSMSAYPGTSQLYGRAKLSCEAVVLGTGGEAVRIGLVWGGVEGGMVASLARLAQLPVLQSFGREVHQYTVHAEDMADAITKLVDAPAVGAPIGLAYPEPVRFETILLSLSARSPRFVRVPWPLIYWPMRLVEAGRLRLPVRADSLLGLIRTGPGVPRVDLWPTLGVHLRPFEDRGQARGT